jgi:hypothetical protein
LAIGSGDPEHVRPVRCDPGEVDPVAGDRLQRAVDAGLHVGHLSAPEALVGQVAEARGETEPEHLEDPEHHVGVGGVVGGDHLRADAAVQVQQCVQNEQAVARGTGHDHLSDAGDLVIDRVEPGDAALEPEVLR